MKYKEGDRVIYLSGADYGCRGVVTQILGTHFAVRWDDTGDTYTYEDWAGSSIDKVRKRPQNN